MSYEDSDAIRLLSNLLLCNYQDDLVQEYVNKSFQSFNFFAKQNVRLVERCKHDVKCIQDPKIHDELCKGSSLK